MKNVIAFKSKSAGRRHDVANKTNYNIISLIDWKATPHPIRTPNGVFFTTEIWQFSGDSA